MDLTELIPKAEALLSKQAGASVRLRVAWIAPRKHTSIVARVEQISGDTGLPRTLILKAETPDGSGDPERMLFNEWAALQYFGDLGCAPPVAPRFYAGSSTGETPFIVMEDLGPGAGSPGDVLEGDDLEAAAAAILDYAAALGRLHACGCRNPEGFRELRAELPAPPLRIPLFHNPWSDARSYSHDEVRRAIEEYRASMSHLGVRPGAGVDGEIERVVHSVEAHDGEFLTVCQGDQNSIRQCIDQNGAHRMIDFGGAGLRHAMIEGIPHRMTWGCINRIPKHLYRPFEERYRKELSATCMAATNETLFRQAMIEAAARWHIFHLIWRVPGALKADRPRGGATLRQQVMAWLSAFAEMTDEFGRFPALGRAAAQAHAELLRQWPGEAHEIPFFPAFRDS